MARRNTTEKFIENARAVHGERYDYSKVVYSASHSKVTIVCPEHGEFHQTPANHNHGFGCRLCGFKNAGQYHKKDTQKFIAEARAKHGDRYDYSQTDYHGARERVTIVCPQHGPFEQVAYVHLASDTGCEPCSYEARGEGARMKFSEFVQLATGVHQGAFDYSTAEATFAGGSVAVAITCPTHGVFMQTPLNHVKGQGCAKCSRIRAADGLRKSTDEFVREATSVHGETYDYSRAVYQGAFTPVAIICALDGEFWQSPTSHLAGIGCPRCSRRGQGAPRNLTRALRGEFDGTKASFVYVIQFSLPFTVQPVFKIGSGTGSRLTTVGNDLKRIGGRNVTVWHREFATPAEAIIFEHLAQDQVRNFQFVIPPQCKFPGHTEVFAKAPDLEAVDNHPILLRFKAGHRWDPRSE